MNILLACFSFRNYTGSEIYFYELSTALRDAGHNVYIFTRDYGYPLADKVEGITFNIDDIEYDLAIMSHGPLIWEYMRNIRAKKIINIIHSEVLPQCESPIVDSKIHSYVGIRPSIVEYIKQRVFGKGVKLIYNPFDFNRFNPDNCRKEGGDKVAFFPGSLDYLRVNALKSLVSLSEKENFKVIHVGRDDGLLGDTANHPNFSSYKPVWEVEKYYRQCDIVSGIFLGRTSIEGLLCGKQVLQFDVGETGDIKKTYWHTEGDLQKFDKKIVAKELLEI